MQKHNKNVEKLIDRKTDGKNSEAAGPEDVNEFWFELQLQDKIDASLIRSFDSPPVAAAQHRTCVEEIIARKESKTESHPARIWSRSRIWALAASILILVGIVCWQFSGNSRRIDFQRESLAKLYDETIERGFKPYYVCEDPIRFAREFKKRQGVPLRLTRMPQQHRMVGISYLGGISRESTTMLGLTSDQPVLVFVDRLSNDSHEMIRQVGRHDGCFVSRRVKEGLVFYEVSQFEEPQLIRYFEKVSE